MDVFKFIVIYVSIGIMLYIGGYKAADHDIIDMLFDLSNEAVAINESVAKQNFPSEGGQSGISTSQIAFINPISLVWGFVLFLYNIAFYPLAIANTLGLPLPLRLFMGAFGVYFIFSVVKFIRGG